MTKNNRKRHRVKGQGPQVNPRAAATISSTTLSTQGPSGTDLGTPATPPDSGGGGGLGTPATPPPSSTITTTTQLTTTAKKT